MEKNKTLLPYRGEQPYIFVSYAHKNLDVAMNIIKRLQLDDYRVWYDEGIDPGTEWDENIGSHIERCGFFIALLSSEYLDSSNCKDELNLVRELEKPRLLIYLEDLQLPVGLRMRLSRLQAIHKYKYSDQEYFFEKVYAAQGISACLNSTNNEAADKEGILLFEPDDIYDKNELKCAINVSDDIAEERIGEFNENTNEMQTPLSNGCSSDKLSDIYIPKTYTKKEKRQLLSHLDDYDYLRKVLGEEHPYTWKALAAKCKLSGEYKKAAEAEEKIYNFSCEKKGGEDPATLELLHNLSFTYEQCGDFQKAIEIETQVYDLRCKIFGADHVDTWKSFEHLNAMRTVLETNKIKAKAKLQEKERKLQKAEQQEKEYYSLCRKLGEDHTDTLRFLHSLALDYEELGKYEKALDLIMKEYTQKVRKYKNPKIANTWELYWRMKEIYSKLIHSAKSFQINPSILQELHDSAVDYDNQGEYEKANSIEWVYDLFLGNEDDEYSLDDDDSDQDI